MKITKNYLKQVIKEELGHLEELGPRSSSDEVLTIILGVGSRKGGEEHYDTKVEYNGELAAPMYPQFQAKFDIALKNLKAAAHQFAYYLDRPKRD